MSLTWEQIKAAAKSLPVTEEVEAPEWGGSVRIRMLSSLERTQFYIKNASDREANDDKPLANYQARFVAACAVNDAGGPLFNDNGDVTALGELPGGGPVIERLYERCRKLNRMFETEEEQKAALKNFETTPSAAGS